MQAKMIIQMRSLLYNWSGMKEIKAVQHQSATSSSDPSESNRRKDNYTKAEFTVQLEQYL